MTTGRSAIDALVADLDAEHKALDALLAELGPDAWNLPTPAAGWQVRHQVVHLEFFDQIGARCVTGDASALDEIRERARAAGARTEDDVSAALLAGRLDDDLRSLLAGWRAARMRLLAAFAAAPPDRRVPWAAGPMALTSFATARLMETWAHGLDCFAAVGARPVDTNRIRHVCHLGYRALPYAFRRAKVDMPAPLEHLRLELAGPNGDTWEIGPASAPEVIRGPAGEWARVAVQRMSAQGATGLTSHGSLAQAALGVARAFA
jgi:uncharacterized protein (TIGR03084 family)